jgi:hypothetical protein
MDSDRSCIGLSPAYHTYPTLHPCPAWHGSHALNSSCACLRAQRRGQQPRLRGGPRVRGRAAGRRARVRPARGAPSGAAHVQHGPGGLRRGACSCASSVARYDNAQDLRSVERAQTWHQTICLELGQNVDCTGAGTYSPHRSSAAASVSGALAACSPSSAAWLRLRPPSTAPAGPAGPAGAGGVPLASSPRAPPPAPRPAPLAASPASALALAPPLADCPARPSGSASSPGAGWSPCCACAPAAAAYLAGEVARTPGGP